MIDEGRRYGLELNASKMVMLRVNHSGSIYHASRELVKVVEEAMYLRRLLTTNADVRPELTRRLREATPVFRKLQ